MLGFFIKYLWIPKISSASTLSISFEKSLIHPYNSVFFYLSTKKSFETLPKHNGDAFISESFALNNAKLNKTSPVAQ